MNTLYVIGIGYKPLDKKAREIILKSEVILASSRLFDVFKGYEEFETVKDRIKVINNVDETINFIRSQMTDDRIQGEKQSKKISSKKSLSSGIVLLASGDPMFFGIGRRAVREFGKDNVEILPDLSSIQMAFARIKEAWDDAFLMSLHGGPDPEKRRRLPYEMSNIPSLLQKHNKIAILTDKENNPSEIAKVLNLSPGAHSLLPVMFVCERLGYPDEKVTEGTPEEITGMTFSEPNVVIIQKTEDKTQKADIVFGLKEEEIAHSRGLITKDEVRAVTIHKLRLPQKGIFWDIGAGSGSVSIEAARLYPELKIFAVEKNEEQTKHIKTNILKFNLSNIEAIKGEAPDALKHLPHPDRVFIGGSGERLREIITAIAKMPVKIIVINAATIETLNEAVQSLENNGFEIEISEISISRAKTVANKKHLSALNPIFVITGQK